MSPPEPLEFVRQHVITVVQVDPQVVEPSSRLIDFGFDSVRVMDLVVELEEAYGIEIPDRDLADLQTLQDIADYVARRRRTG